MASTKLKTLLIRECWPETPYFLRLLGDFFMEIFGNVNSDSNFAPAFIFLILNSSEMNKGDLINKVAEDANLTKAQASDAVNSVVDAISGALKGGDKVTLIGFGTFSTSERPARTGRNPQTGATIKIAAKTNVKFKAGKELTEAVN